MGIKKSGDREQPSEDLGREVRLRSKRSLVSPEDRRTDPVLDHQFASGCVRQDLQPTWTDWPLMLHLEGPELAFYQKQMIKKINAFSLLRSIILSHILSLVLLKRVGLASDVYWSCSSYNVWQWYKIESHPL
jgi:hypothetical protein